MQDTAFTVLPKWTVNLDTRVFVQIFVVHVRVTCQLPACCCCCCLSDLGPCSCCCSLYMSCSCHLVKLKRPGRYQSSQKPSCTIDKSKRVNRFTNPTQKGKKQSPMKRRNSLQQKCLFCHNAMKLVTGHLKINITNCPYIIFSRLMHFWSTKPKKRDALVVIPFPLVSWL